MRKYIDRFPKVILVIIALAIMILGYICYKNYYNYNFLAYHLNHYVQKNAGPDYTMEHALEKGIVDITNPLEAEDENITEFLEKMTLYYGRTEILVAEQRNNHIILTWYVKLKYAPFLSVTEYNMSEKNPSQRYQYYHQYYIQEDTFSNIKKVVLFEYPDDGFGYTENPRKHSTNAPPPEELLAADSVSQRILYQYSTE